MRHSFSVRPHLDRDLRPQPRESILVGGIVAQIDRQRAGHFHLLPDPGYRDSLIPWDARPDVVYPVAERQLKWVLGICQGCVDQATHFLLPLGRNLAIMDTDRQAL